MADAGAVTHSAVAVLRTGKEIAHGNLVEATAACAIMWAGWPLVARLYVHQYDTGAMADAYERLEDLAGDLGDSRTTIDELVAAVTREEWHGDSRDEFDRWMGTFGSDLHEEELAARVLGVAVLAAASALYAFVVYTSTIVLRLTWLAIKVGWKSLTGVGFLTAQLECGIEARALFAELTASEARLASVLNGLAAAISGALAVKVAHDGGLQDLRQATISQGPLLIWGTASHLERNLTARMMQGKSPLFSKLDRWRGRARPDQVGTPRPIGPRELLPHRWQLGVAGKGAIDVFSDAPTVTSLLKPERREDGTYEGYRQRF